jgi:hypothetical protein
MERLVIDPSFIAILSFHGCDWVFSVSNGGEMEYIREVIFGIKMTHF